MRKINMFAAALILVGLGAWNPLQMMAGAANLPTSHYVDYTLIFP